MRRRRVVLPEPLSPRIVKNSPDATSSEMSRRTGREPKCFTTSRIDRSESVRTDAAALSAIVDVICRFRSRFRDWCPWKTSLGGLYFIPDLVVFIAARHLLPEIDTRHVEIDVVEVQRFSLIFCHELCRLRVSRIVASDVGHRFLSFCFDHIFEKLCGELFMLAGGCNHQMIDPSRGVFLWDRLANGEIRFAKLIRHERPAHRGDHFVIREKIR